MILTVKDGHVRIYFSNCSFVVPKQKYFNKLFIQSDHSFSKVVPFEKTIDFSKV